MEQHKEEAGGNWQQAGENFLRVHEHCRKAVGKMANCHLTVVHWDLQLVLSYEGRQEEGEGLFH
jgi:hypothetical protein